MRIFFLSILFIWSLGGQTFYPDDPIGVEPDPLRVDDAAFRKLNDYYDLFLHEFSEPGEVQPKRGEPIRAQSTNTIDEVPDSHGWYTNRIGSRPMSIAEIVRGPGDDRPPADGVWTIVAAKTEGVTPGFRIRDTTGQQYLLKFDPLGHAEMATAADVIGSMIFHALGYNVPQNYLVEFDPDSLEIDKDATIPDIRGMDRPIDRFDVDHALLRVPRLGNGRVRAVASRLLSGRVIGEFRYFGTRSDDYNDIVPHEHRRELRGLFVFDAWLNHNDSRAINDLDTLVEEGGLKYVKHYLIDFGAILGSASVLSNTARDGNAYFYEPRSALAQAFTLGLYVPRWLRAKYKRSPAVGMINWDAFQPDAWKPNYPNPAFRNRLPDDEFWAAKKVMAFSDEQLAAVVKAARYSDPRDQQWITTYLQERRNRIGEVYMQKVLPLDGFRVGDGELAFEDLGVRYGFTQPLDLTYKWSRFDNQTGEHTAIEGAAGPRIPASDSQYLSAELSAGEEGKTVMVWVRKTSNGFEAVGVQRNWP